MPLVTTSHDDRQTPMTPRERWMWRSQMEAAYTGRVRFLMNDAPTLATIQHLHPDEWSAVIGLREMGEDAGEVGRLLAESIVDA